MLAPPPCSSLPSSGGHDSSLTGVQVRQCSLSARADFVSHSVTGTSTTDVTFPIDFKECSYGRVWRLLIEKEDQERTALGLPALPPTSLSITQAANQNIPQPQFSYLQNKAIKQPPFCLVFTTPHPSYSAITSITVNDIPAAYTITPQLDSHDLPRIGAIPSNPGDRHSLAEYDMKIPAHLGEQWESDLFIALPVRVLRLQLLRAFLAVKETLQASSAIGPEDLPVGNMAFSLSVSIDFKLLKPRPSNSLLFFVTRAMRVDQTNVVKEYPMLMTAQKLPSPAGQSTWFPSVPFKIFSASDSKGRFHYRVHWNLKFTVPAGYTCLAPGHLIDIKSLEEDGRLWDTYSFETQGEYGTLIPSQIAWYAAHMTVVDGQEDRMAPFLVSLDLRRSSKSQPQSSQSKRKKSVKEDEEEDEDEEEGFESNLMEEEERGFIGAWNDGQSSTVNDGGNVEGAKEEEEGAVGGEEDESEASLGHISFATPPHLHPLLRVTVAHLPLAIRFIQDMVKNPQSLTNLTIAFLPVGNYRPWTENRLTEKRGGYVSGGEEMSAQALLDGGESGLPQQRFLSVPSSVSIGSRYWIFGNLIVLDCSLMHSHNENHEGVRLAKLAIVEAILGYWFGSLLDVPPAKASEDLWLALAIRKYFTFKVHMEFFGRIDATLYLHRLLQEYLRAVELGEDRVPLSAASKQCLNLGTMNDLSPLFQLKCALIFPALECLAVSNSNGRNWLAATFFRQAVTAYGTKLLARYPKSPLATDKFFDKLIHRAKAVFIRSKLHTGAVVKSAASEENEELAAQIKGLGGIKNPSQLDVGLYQGHPLYDISEWIEDIYNFQRSYINGTGCPLVTLSIVCEMQKRTFTLETFKVRIDECALQPPAEVLAKEEVSNYIPAIQAAVGGLNSLLQHPELINFAEPPENMEVEPEQNSASSLEAAALRQLKLQLTQCSQALTFLEQLKFSLDSTLYNPIELIVRDQRCTLGFGYLGQTTSPIIGGKGPLFSIILRLAATSWATLTAEQRSTMASDTPLMETLVASITNGFRIHSGATGGQPGWLVSLLSWQCIRNALSIQEMCPHQTRHQGVYADFAWAKSWIRGTHCLQLPEACKAKVQVELPESAGVAKFWPIWLRLCLFEDNKVSDASLCLRDAAPPNVITIRDASQPSVRSAFGTQRIRNANCARILGVSGPLAASQPAIGGELYRFQGALHQSADAELLNASCTEAVRLLFSAGVGAAAGVARPNLDNALESAADTSAVGGAGGSSTAAAEATGTRSRIPAVRAMPILWTRLGEDSFNIARIRRFQSFSMWIHQMLNDTCPFAQIEAIDAVCAVDDSTQTLAALKACVSRARLHPYVRGAAAIALARLTRLEGSMGVHATQVLMQEVWPAAKGVPTLPKASWMPPLFSATAMSYLIYVVHAISKVRDSDGDTPEEVYSAFEECLESLPSPVDTRVDRSALPKDGDDLSQLTPAICDHTLNMTVFVASLVQEMQNLTFAAVPPQEVVSGIEDGIVGEGGKVVVGGDAESVNFWSLSFIDSRTQSIFMALWRWFKMEQKFVTGPQLVTRSLLNTLATSPSLVLLMRKKFFETSQLTFDPLRLFIPLRVLLPSAPVAGIAEKFPKAEPEMSAYLYLHKFILTATGALEASYNTPPNEDGSGAGASSYFWPELMRAVTYASQCFNYVDPIMCQEALRATITLILQGRLLPPPYLLISSPLDIVNCPSPTYTATFSDQNATSSLFDSEDKKIIDSLYPPQLRGQTQSPLNCEWIDDFSRQQLLMRSGSAVLAAVRLVAQLQNLLPFADMHELVVNSWSILLQCLQSATQISPIALLPFCIVTPLAHAPLLPSTLAGLAPVGGAFASPHHSEHSGGITKKKSSKKVSKHRKAGRRSAVTATPSAPSTAAPSAPPKIVVPAIGGSLTEDHSVPPDDAALTDWLSEEEPAAEIPTALHQSTSSWEHGWESQFTCLNNQQDQDGEDQNEAHRRTTARQLSPPDVTTMEEQDTNTHTKSNFNFGNSIGQTTAAAAMQEETMEEETMEETAAATEPVEHQSETMDDDATSLIELDSYGINLDTLITEDQKEEGIMLGFDDAFDDMMLTEMGNSAAMDASDLDMVPDDAVMAEDLQAEDLQAEDLQAEDLQAEDLQVEDLQAEDLQAEDLQAEDLQAEDALLMHDGQSKNPPAFHRDPQHQSTMDFDPTQFADSAATADAISLNQHNTSMHLATYSGNDSYLESDYRDDFDSESNRKKVLNKEDGSTKKKKKKSASRKSASNELEEPGAESPIIIPPVITTFELLFNYLQTIASSTVAHAAVHVWGVRECIRFLFGSGIPRPVATCRSILDALKPQMAATGELSKVEAYIAEHYKCLAPPSTQNARLAGKMVSKSNKAGLPLKQIPTYEKSFVNVWSLSQKPQSWPLPLEISWQSLALKLTECLMEHPSAIWFIHPVDGQQMPTYYKIIEHPMWLTKVVEQLKKHEYETFEQWKSDLFRIFRNCRTYNLPQTPVMIDCDILQGLAYQLLRFAERLLTPYDATAS